MLQISKDFIHLGFGILIPYACLKTFLKKKVLLVVSMHDCLQSEEVHTYRLSIISVFIKKFCKHVICSHVCSLFISHTRQIHTYRLSIISVFGMCAILLPCTFEILSALRVCKKSYNRVMADKKIDKELREIMRELDLTDCKERQEINLANDTDDQKAEWQISDAFKVRFMNNWIFWIVGFHVVAILYFWLR